MVPGGRVLCSELGGIGAAFANSLEDVAKWFEEVSFPLGARVKMQREFQYRKQSGSTTQFPSEVRPGKYPSPTSTRMDS